MACSELMVSGVIAFGKNMSPADKAQSLRGAIAIFGNVCTDGNYGIYHPYIARIYTLLSVYLWLDGKKTMRLKHWIVLLRNSDILRNPARKARAAAIPRPWYA